MEKVNGYYFLHSPASSAYTYSFGNIALLTKAVTPLQQVYNRHRR